MSLKAALVLMTVVAVVSDTLLDPFYPQYFETVLGVSDAQHVGFYIAACALTVMSSFPVWARISERLPVLPLLVATQLATGGLCLALAATTSLALFWALSLVMMVFKASYLLIYPYVMSLEDEEHHVGTISLLAFVVYFGHIVAALLSGLVFELVAPRFLFVVMACADGLQILVCLHMLRMSDFGASPATEGTRDADARAPLPPRFVLRLGAVMFMMYFGAYLSEPFFSLFWERTSALDNRMVSGLVFGLPGIVAILAVWVNTRLRQPGGPHAGIASAMGLGLCGLWLQASGQPVVLLVGRLLYGWALFQAMVRLDLLLFRVSQPETYASDFSRIHLFQSLGTLAASFSAGTLVASYGLRMPFLVAGGGLLLCMGMYWSLFRRELRGGPADVGVGLAEDDIREGRAIS